MNETDRARPPGSRLAFGPFLIDTVRRLLWHHGRVVQLTDKTFDVLATLLEHRDHVLEKDELLKRVWHGTFVQENNLVRHISMLRRALGQSPEQHDYIVTVPGVGYRFVAEVAELDVLPADLPTSVGPETKPSAQPEAPDGARDLASSGPAPTDSGAPPTELAPDNGNPAGEPLDRGAEPRPAVGETARQHVVVPVSPSETRALVARRRLRVTAIWAVPAALLATLAAVQVARRILDAPRGSDRPRSLRQVTYGPDVQMGPSWSPDGRSLAFSSNRSGDFEIWVQHLDQPEPTRITQSEGPDWQPSWSPDGRLIAFRSERQGGGLDIISPRGESLRRVANFGYEPRWSPDSSRLLFQSGQLERLRPQPYVVGLDGQPPQLARPDLTAQWVVVRTAWHPDGTLTFWGRSDDGHWALVKAPVTGASAISFVLPSAMEEQLREMNLALGSFAWAPNGEFIYFEGVSMQVRNLWRVRINPATMRWLGAPERLTLGEGGDTSITVARDGKRLAFGALREKTRLWSIPLDARLGDGQPLTSGGAGEFDAAVSADGGTLVYRTIRFGRQELWARTLADNTQRLLIASTDWVRSSPRLSNDGRRVAYRLTSSGGTNAQTSGVAVLEPNGSEMVLSAPSGLVLIPDDWSKDDSRILGTCIAPKTRRFSVCTIAARPNSQAEILVTEQDHEFYSPHYSPNQRWISVVERGAPRGRDWKAAIAVMPAQGGSRVRITDGSWNDEKPRWASDGRALYFVSNRDGFLNLWGRHFNPDSGKPEGDVFQVTHFNSPDRRIPPDLSLVEISISGNRMFLPLTELSATIWALDGPDR